jgi:probable O-glycosylation ligase (exosortase A-associated)
MRDVALALFVAGVLPYAVRYTWVGVMLWTWLSVMNPHRLMYGFAYAQPWALMAALATIASLFLGKDEKKLPLTPPVIALVLFIAWMCFTTLFAFNPEDARLQLEKVLKIQLMTLIALAAIRSRRHIELFVWVNALSLAYYGVKGGIFTIRSGGGNRVWGPAGSFIEGNNEVALALVMIVPLLNYLRLVAQQPWVRAGLLVATLLSAVAAIGSYSRGAFLAAVAMGAVLWWRSSRKLVSGLLIVMVGIGLVSFMPEGWEARMRTIESYEENKSAMGRIEAWTAAFNVANARFVGGGFEFHTPEVFAQYTPGYKARAVHSIYLTVLGEHGWIGMLLFVSIGAFAFVIANRLRKEALNTPDAQWVYALAGMIQVSMVGYAVGGTFLSLSYFDLPYNVLVMLVACQAWMREKRWQTEKNGPFGSGEPVDRIKARPRSLGGTPVPR